MSLPDRGMNRHEFRRLISTELFSSRIEIPGFKGTAGILYVHKTDGEWKVRSKEKELIIAAPGYKWLQLAPDHEKWWLTVMYDIKGSLIQYYFDITKRHYTSETGERRFVDLFLDVVMMPDGSYEILDREELVSAYRAAQITEFDYRRALSALYELVGAIAGKVNVWRALCDDVIPLLEKNSRGEK